MLYNTLLKEEFCSLFFCLTFLNFIIGRVYGLLKDWDGKTPMKESDFPLLYEEMDDFSAGEMQKLDDEIQAIKVLTYLCLIINLL